MDFDADPNDEDADDDGGEDAEEIPPPDARRVAARCGVFLALAYRARIEGDSDREVAREERQRLLAWIRDTPVDGEMEPAERRIVKATIGTLSPDQVFEASWVTEPAAVLGWALGRFPLPTYDALVNDDAVYTELRLLEHPWTLPRKAKLRSPGELEGGWASALTVHWRLAEYGLRPVPRDLVQFVAECRWAPLTTTGLELRDGDLLLRGRTLAESGEDLPECAMIAAERHRAFEWLLGGNAKLWSEVTADT